MEILQKSAAVAEISIKKCSAQRSDVDVLMVGVILLGGRGAFSWEGTDARVVRAR
ncbi:hypothetical protein [Robbsia sp. KACC 23696]|uniref:hypothetical protein n=1 Tax=Robbsia sp. KACC 23696 TaxID=3149231 RepID=UPI00325B4041